MLTHLVTLCTEGLLARLVDCGSFTKLYVVESFAVTEEGVCPGAAGKTVLEARQVLHHLAHIHRLLPK